MEFVKGRRRDALRIAVEVPNKQLLEVVSLVDVVRYLANQYESACRKHANPLFVSNTYYERVLLA